ncbi:MAG TPA: hypothetical protein VIG33_00785 [Pseudobdellovibrionaceae bacterium]|jgi:hypothetical protein
MKEKMKVSNDKNFKLWLEAEKALSVGLPAGTAPEVLRTSGLLRAQSQAWSAALLRLEEAVRNGISDLQTLDALGEAAYQTQTYQALLPFEDLYRDPMIAIHMARALMMLGQISAAHFFLRLAPDSLLKAAISAVLGVEKNIETSMTALFKPLIKKEMETVNCIEYWQALAPVAEVAGRKDLVHLAEQRLKALAYARPVIHYNQSLRLLAEGEFRAGWKLYDWRLVPGSACPAMTGFADFSMWEGEFLAGKKILVVMENGLGDQIFGLRYLQTLAEEGAEVNVAVGPELAALAQSSFPSMKIHDLEKARELTYWKDKSRPDFWTYCLSIPARADLGDPLATAGYLKASESLVLQCQRSLNLQNPRKLPVHGLVWHGDIRTAPMRTRAYTLTEFLRESEILKTPCLLVCLQKDVTQEELSELRAQADKRGCLLFNAAPSLQNFAQTAAWINCVDHMWSCDTSTAHLAGALGVRTTVMIRNKAIWHWRCEAKTQKAVWYDSCHIKYALTPPISYMFDIRDPSDSEGKV